MLHRLNRPLVSPRDIRRQQQREAADEGLLHQSTPNDWRATTIYQHNHPQYHDDRHQHHHNHHHNPHHHQHIIVIIFIITILVFFFNEAKCKLQSWRRDVMGRRSPLS